MEGQLPGSSSFNPIEYSATRELEHPLLSLNEIASSTLVWIQPQLMRPAYELWAAERVVATLRFKGLLRQEGLGAAAEGLWTFNRAGVEQKEIKVYQYGIPFATLTPKDDRISILTLVDGRVYIWQHAEDQQWFFLSMLGKPLLQFIPENSVQARMRVEINQDAPRTSRLTFLALLGKYVLLGRKTVAVT